MSEMKNVVCPNCGRELSIPAELEEYSCLYCGSRNQLKRKENIDPAAFEAARAGLREKLALLITPYEGYFKKITKKDFFTTFEAYENATRDTMNAIADCARLHPEGEEAGAAKMAEDILSELQAAMERDPRWKSKRKQENMLFEYRVVMAIFLTPALRRRGFSCAEKLRTELNRQWLERYPRQEWTPGDYDTMAAGFKKRKLCFITTATCAHEGKADDCEELEAFRSFRDGWLRANGGEALIDEYYKIAPAIVTCIELCDSSDARYEEIRTRWLAPCYLALQEGRYADCRKTYVDMVHTLENRYLN